MKGTFVVSLICLGVTLYAAPLEARGIPEKLAPASPLSVPMRSAPETVQPVPANPAQALLEQADAEQRELWSGSLYTSTYRAGACIAPDGKVRGVLLLRTAGGAVDTYHFDGTFENGIIRARHSSGHSFKGSFPADKEITGTITLKSGRTVTLSGNRQRDVKLTETCRPLPE